LRPKPLVLLILDGWGVREPTDDNAIARAETPNWDRLWTQCPHSLLSTSGEAVGLPPGQMGNSEVGHMNLGAGRVVYQDLVRISRALQAGELDDHAELRQVIKTLADEDRTLHLMGLLSPGGVHSHEDQLFELTRVLHRLGAPRIALHAFLDGRDTPPQSAEASLRKLQALVEEIDTATVASISGRFYAMDRDRRWERTEQAWRTVVQAKAELHAATAVEALRSAYERGENDEFVQPTVIGDGCAMADGDAVLFANFRADRARQLSQALAAPDFDGFASRRPRLQRLITLTEYLPELPALVLFPPQTLPHLLGDELAAAGMRQLRIAETEKYAHVTFFFNGGREQPASGEERVLIPSPKVRTYDLQPQMSAPELNERLADAIRSGSYDVIIANVANPDMVGHTGDFDAAIQAVEAVDDLLGKVDAAIEAGGGELLVTADHGNVEQMRDPETGQPHTAHTSLPVPLVYRGCDAVMQDTGALCDVAPTMLRLLELEQPPEMTGKPLIRIQSDAARRRA